MDTFIEINGVNIDAQVTFDLDFDNISDPFTVYLFNDYENYIDYTYDTWEGKKTFSITLSKGDTLKIYAFYGNESTQAIMYLDNIAVSYDLKPEIRIDVEDFVPNSYKDIETTQDIYTITFNEKEFAGVYYKDSDEKVRDIYIAFYTGYGKGTRVTCYSDGTHVNFNLNANNKYTLVVGDSAGAVEEIFIYYDVIKDRGIFLDIEYYSDIEYITAFAGKCDIANKSGNYMLKLISQDTPDGYNSFISIDISSIKSDLAGKKIKVNCQFDNGEDSMMKYTIYCRTEDKSFGMFSRSNYIEVEDFDEITTDAIDDEYDELQISFYFDNPDTIAYIDFEIVEA
ncbi:MAG: hypothetical protein GX756_06275 [Clostridiales bacterium]|nr:hypothetical protein [Clostridiales bacterium]